MYRAVARILSAVRRNADLYRAGDLSCVEGRTTRYLLESGIVRRTCLVESSAVRSGAACENLGRALLSLAIGRIIGSCLGRDVRVAAALVADSRDLLEAVRYRTLTLDA